MDLCGTKANDMEYRSDLWLGWEKYGEVGGESFGRPRRKSTGSIK